MSIDLDAKPRTRKDIHNPLSGPVHLTDEGETQETPQSIMKESELAELAARGRAGFATIADDAPVLPEGWGEVVTPEERAIAVTAYGPDGESIVVEQAIPFYETKDGEVVDPPRAAGDWSASTPVIQITLPGFGAPIDVDIVKLNFTGNIELDIVGEEHRAIWNALRWKGMVTLIVQAKVRDLALQERTGDRAQATLKILSVTRPEAARSPYEEGDEDETVCDRCGENPAIDGLYCGACIEVMEAEDAEEPPAADAPYDLDAALADAGTEDGE